MAASVQSCRQRSSWYECIYSSSSLSTPLPCLDVKTIHSVLFFFFLKVNTTNGHSSAAPASDISHLVRKKVRELASGLKIKLLKCVLGFTTVWSPLTDVHCRGNQRRARWRKAWWRRWSMKTARPTACRNLRLMVMPTETEMDTIDAKWRDECWTHHKGCQAAHLDDFFFLIFLIQITMRLINRSSSRGLQRRFLSFSLRLDSLLILSPLETISDNTSSSYRLFVNTWNLFCLS